MPQRVGKRRRTNDNNTALHSNTLYRKPHESTVARYTHTRAINGVMGSFACGTSICIRSSRTIKLVALVSSSSSSTRLPALRYHGSVGELILSGFHKHARTHAYQQTHTPTDKDKKEVAYLERFHHTSSLACTAACVRCAEKAGIASQW